MSDNGRAYKENAPANLAALLKRETGVVIDPLLLRLFIRSQWEEVSRLAHVIHRD